VKPVTYSSYLYCVKTVTIFIFYLNTGYGGYYFRIEKHTKESQKKKVSHSTLHYSPLHNTIYLYNFN